MIQTLDHRIMSRVFYHCATTAVLPEYCSNDKDIYWMGQGILTAGVWLSTLDLLIKVTCFVKNMNNIFNKKELI